MSKTKSSWLNNTDIRVQDIEKPCVKLQYCPYGQLVEEYPFSFKDYPKVSCTYVNGAIIQFGRDCPVHYLAEFVKK